jgi:uncharacterized damage-inducible protein DinB
MPNDDALRQQLARMLAWDDAHVGFERVVADLDPGLRGVVPSGLPHSAWQLLEHLRLAQRDILEFCTRADYEERQWPDDYWPETVEPPSAAAWQASIEAFTADRDAMAALATNPATDLLATIPHGSGQTYLREILLVVDHNAYHVGQLVLVRRALGAWKD